jgi:hypothetical protein
MPISRENVFECLAKLPVNNLYTIFKALTLQKKQVTEFKKASILNKISDLINEDEKKLEEIYNIANELEVKKFLTCISKANQQGE